jgi:hypothetical protein
VREGVRETVSTVFERRLRPVMIATALGFWMIVAGFLGGAGWESVVVEIGAGLLLVAIVYLLEENLRRAIEEQSEQIDRRIESLEQAERERRAAPATFTEAVDAGHNEMIRRFESEPAIETLAPIFERLKHLGIPVATNLYPHDETMFNVSWRPDQSLAVKILPNGAGSKRRPRSASLTWTPDEDYDSFIHRLGESWLFTGLYPGHDTFHDVDFAGDLAVVLAEQLDRVVRPPDR